MKNYNYRFFMIKAYKLVTRALKDDKKVGQVSSEVRDLVNSYTDLNRDERYELFCSVFDLFKRCRGNNWQAKLAILSNYDMVLSAARRINRKKSLRNKRETHRANMNSGKYVFYLCSEHSKPMDEHKDYQGKIYVDKYWRMKSDGKDYYAIISYIKNHKTPTVQEIMNGPVFLCNTPNCRHYFIPISTDEVLHSSEGAIAKRRRLKSYTPCDYYSLRSKVFQIIYSIEDSVYFKRAYQRSIKKREYYS